MADTQDFRYTPDIKGYQEALWHFLLEHSEITTSGKVFIKFHCNDKKNFENRVLARWKYNYHREDVDKKAEFKDKQKIQNDLERRKKKEIYREQKRSRRLLLKH